MTYCGKSLDKSGFKDVVIKNLDQQLKCITFNMKKAGVMHRDMHRSGKNLCVNNDGIVSVIDFDIAKIGNVSDEYCINFENKMKQIIKSKRIKID